MYQYEDLISLIFHKYTEYNVHIYHVEKSFPQLDFFFLKQYEKFSLKT